ncbi:hypothetical protein HanIR_Chr08g0389941 [Helianthus annuus]|nr:hypothetical protein HanIR_Chr08g0389941 [Helianthus annuus]
MLSTTQIALSMYRLLEQVILSYLSETHINEKKKHLHKRRQFYFVPTLKHEVQLVYLQILTRQPTQLILQAHEAAS